MRVKSSSRRSPLPATRKVKPERSALNLLDEAVQLLRQQPLRLAGLQLTGTIPFLLGALYFWEDMGRNPYAGSLLPAAAVLLTVLFAWMQFWLAVGARSLREQLGSLTPQPWTFRRCARLLLVQMIFQPWSLILLPIASLVIFPFGYLHALFHNLTVLADEPETPIRQILSRAHHLARVWPARNLLVIWLASPWLMVNMAVLGLAVVPLLKAVYPQGWNSQLVLFLIAFAAVVSSPLGTVLFINLSLVLLALPVLFNTLLGVETVFSRSIFHLVNPLFIALVTGLCGIGLDLLLRTVQGLHCFYGESRSTGADLLVSLRRMKMKGKAALFLLCLFLVPAAGQAPAGKPAPAVTPPALDQAISRQIQAAEYSWRIPKEQIPVARAGEEQGGIWRTLDDWFLSLRDWYRRWKRWLGQFLPDGAAGPDSPAGIRQELLQGLLWFFALAAAGLVIWLVVKVKRRGRSAPPSLLPGTIKVPDLRDENVLASALPEDEWLELARKLLEQGDCRLAVRAVYFSILARLAGWNYLIIAKAKTDREYEREVCRKAHVHPRLAGIFGNVVTLFERVWYGPYPADAATVSVLLEQQEQLQANEQA